MGSLHISQLKQGMVIGESLVDKNTGKLLLKTGTRLTNNLIDRLEEFGFSFVEVEDQYTLLLNPDDNMENLLNDCYKAAIKKIVSQYPQGSMNDHAFEVGKKIIPLTKQIIENEKIRKSCINMQIVNFRALLMTGVYASVYSMFVAAVMELQNKEILNIGIAALLHDIGMCEMPYLVNEKNMPPNMMALYREHPTYAYYMLKEQEYSEEIAEIIYSHHERYDGEGFPRGLKWQEIPIGGRIVGLCSDYDNFVNVQRMAPYEAIEYMYGNSGFCYDKAVIKAFTENIPVYSMGSMVELTTGEIGIVVNVRKNRGPRPIVRIFYNRMKKEFSQPYLMDLGVEKTIFIKNVINN